MRLARVNGILAGCLAALCLWRCQLPAHGQADASDGKDPIETPCSGPIYADFITRLGVQYVNTGLPIFAAFQTHSAELDETGSARFRVYALTADPRRCLEVTAAYLLGPVDRNLGKLRVRLRPKAPLSGPLNTVKLIRDPTAPYLQYTPPLRWGPRIDTLTFEFTTPRPRTRFAADFDLQIPGLFGARRAVSTPTDRVAMR